MGLKADKIRIVDDLKDRLIEESLNEIYVFSADDLKFLFANKGPLKVRSSSMPHMLIIIMK